MSPLHFPIFFAPIRLNSCIFLQKGTFAGIKISQDILCEREQLMPIGITDHDVGAQDMDASKVNDIYSYIK